LGQIRWRAVIVVVVVVVVVMHSVVDFLLGEASSLPFTISTLVEVASSMTEIGMVLLVNGHPGQADNATVEAASPGHLVRTM
jgi:hypothetical protein